MESILGIRSNKPNSSPLEGTDTFRAQQAESALRQLARREWWLWLSALFVATLSALAFGLSSFSSLFDLPTDLLKRAAQLLHLYENAAKESFSSTLAPH